MYDATVVDILYCLHGGPDQFSSVTAISTPSVLGLAHPAWVDVRFIVVSFRAYPIEQLATGTEVKDKI